MPSISNREEDVEDEEEEEVSYTGEEEEDDDEEEEEVRKDRSNRKKDTSRSRKRGPASAFLDVAAEEDEDEEGDRRQKRSRFIDDIAEVDEDEEDDELEEEGLEDLIDDAGEQAHDAVDMVALRRQMREAEAQAAQDAELNPEALQEYLKNRYGGQARQYYGGGGGGSETELGAVAQQALLPKASDPKLWVVRCTEGAEREIVVCLLQKAYDLAQRGRPLLVKSAFCQDHLKGYLYVEAFKEAHVSEALKGLRAIFQSRKPRMVPLDEMTAALAVQAPKVKAIDAGSWVRVKAGLYKNDLAHVVDLDGSGERASIRLVPRLDLAALDSRSAGRGSGPNKQATSRPPPKAFNPDEARQFRALDVLTQRDRTTGEMVHVLNGTQRFQEGYLVKTVAMKGLILVEGVPPLDELQRFQAASIGGGGKGTGGSTNGSAGTEDLASLVQSLSTAEASSGVPLFQKGDVVVVVQGDLAGIQGRVEGTGEGGLIMVRPEDAKLPGFTELVGFQPRELQKHFEPGTHVRAASGSHAGETGMVVSSTGGIVTVFTDVSREEIRVLARDLVPAAAVASAALDTLGTYELHDLVALDATTVGVIVGIDDKDTCRVLTNQGRPEKPDVRVCRLPDLKRKLNNRRAAAQDGARNEVAVGDIVEVVDGPLRGRSGTVRYVVRGLLFVQSREVPDNGGFACVQARHCRVRGGRKPVSASNPLATPARHSTDGFGGHPSSNPGGVLASPARQGGGGFGSFGATQTGPYGASSRITTSADRLLEGRMITIRQGPHRGMRGRVVSCTPTHLRLELEAQMKTVTVDRSHVAQEDGGVRRSDMADTGFGGGFNGVGATPARVGATPARWAGATPLRPTATPVREALTRTPAYDPAWAATPAHPGFGSQTGGDLPASPRRDTPSTARYHADTPGSSYIPPTARVDPYLAAPSPYSPSPALTPGLAALTPGLSYPDPGVASTTGTPATAARNASLLLCWTGVEVSVGAGRGVVTSVDAAAGRATVLRGIGTESSWMYDTGNETVQVPVADLEPVAPQRGDIVKLLQGDLAGKSGELVGTDGGDGIIKLGPEIKIWELVNVGRVVPGFDA